MVAAVVIYWYTRSTVVVVVMGFGIDDRPAWRRQLSELRFRRQLFEKSISSAGMQYSPSASALAAAAAGG